MYTEWLIWKIVFIAHLLDSLHETMCLVSTVCNCCTRTKLYVTPLFFGCITIVSCECDIIVNREVWVDTL